MYIPRSQLRLSDAEVEELVRETLATHIATVSEDHEPHISPIGVVLEQGALYMVSMEKSRRMRDIARGSRVAVCVDHWGRTPDQHRGAVFYGRCEDAELDPVLVHAKKAFAIKHYDDPTADPSRPRTHRWIKLVPDHVVTWDFRKIPRGADRVSAPPEQHG